MAVKLPETTLIEIRKNLIEVGNQLDSAIVKENLDIENKEDNREKIWNENIIDKTKTTLSSDEKKRLVEISKTFVKQWVDAVKKFKEQEKKKGLLSGALSTLKKKVTAPFRFISDFLKKKQKKVEPPKEKKKMSWITKLLLIIGGLTAAWFLFKSIVKKIPEKFLGPLREMKDAAIGLISKAWDIVCNYFKEKIAGLWDWIKTTLHLDAIGNFFTEMWNNVTGWFSSIWEKIKGIWKSTKEAVVNFPGKMWDWICDTAKALFQPVIDAITVAWNWIKEKVVGFWNWIKEQVAEFWDGLKKTWKSVCDFFSGIWDWVTDTFSFEKIWNNIKNFINSFIKEIKDDISLLLSGQFKELIVKKVNTFLNFFSTVSDKLKNSWLGRKLGLSDKDSEKETKEEIKTKVKSDVTKVIEKQEEIQLKDNVLETVKAICDRINVFFSGNKNGFIELSDRLVKQVSGGFDELKKQLENIKLNNVYNIEQDNTYRDSYDQSDNSTKTINNDFSKHTNDNYGISYNTIDIPALNNAVSLLEKQNEAEIKLLTSQNDYLAKMINNIDGLGDKLTFLDKKEYTPQQNNAIIPILGIPSRPGIKVFDTSDLKLAQQRYAAALNV